MSDALSVMEFAHNWRDAALYPSKSQIHIEVIRQGWEVLRIGQSFVQRPICVAGQTYEHGLGVHADSEVKVHTIKRAKRITGVVGVDQNPDTLKDKGGHCRLVFSIETKGKTIWSSPLLTLGEGLSFDVTLDDITELTLKVDAENGWIHYAHADWADLRLRFTDGTQAWVGDTLEQQRLPQSPIFSFTCGDKHSDDLLPKWLTNIETERISPDLKLTRKTFRDPATGLTCILEMKQYSDFPALEWVLRLRNDGAKNTPILQDIQAMRINWACAKQTILHHAHGSHGVYDDFRYLADPVTPSSKFEMSAGGGRSSSDWLPYFNLQTDGCGVVAAIGWSGQWAAQISRGEGNEVLAQAGLEKSHLTLHPGEEIRTPSISLIFWQGTPIDANNALRRFIIAHHTPQIDGKILQAPFTTGQWGGVKTDKHLRAVEQVHQKGLHYDFYWIDAGWYGPAEAFSEEEATGKWYGQAGSWNANPISHPNGLRPIGDATNKAEMGFLLWFEPERAVWGSQITREHPEWFLGQQKMGWNVLLDLGNPEALQWITDFISNKITEWKIGCFRQDFNFEPLGYWRDADAEDRQGITETRHIEGLYKFWDELRRRHPSLIIDNCASGGRRLDIELVGRSISLWRSDFQCLGNGDALGIQTHNAGLSYWLPLHGTSSDYRPGDTYYFRSALSAALNFHLPAPEDLPADYPWDWHHKMADEYLRARPFYYGDYYPLLPYSTVQETWTAYQMHRPDLKSGLALVIRREKSAYTKATLPFFGLNPDATYEIEHADTGDIWLTTGHELVNAGLPVSLPEPRSTQLLFYKERLGTYPVA